MKQLFSALRRVLEKLGGLFVSKPAVDRPVVLKSEEGEPETSEAERLDRLRNPRDYRGR
jgi:hypothetical protein